MTYLLQPLYYLERLYILVEAVIIDIAVIVVVDIAQVRQPGSPNLLVLEHTAGILRLLPCHLSPLVSLRL